MCKVTSLLHVCSPSGASSCIYSMDGHHSIFTHQPSYKSLFKQFHSPDFATLAFCTIFMSVIPGHARYGAKTWPRRWCWFWKQSQVPSYQEGCWKNGSISEFLPLTLPIFVFRLSIFPLSTMLSWTGSVEWPCSFLSMLCLNQHVQDQPQLLPEAHLGVGTKCPWSPQSSGERSGIPATYPAPQT